PLPDRRARRHHLLDHMIFMLRNLPLGSYSTEPSFRFPSTKISHRGSLQNTPRLRLMLPASPSSRFSRATASFIMTGTWEKSASSMLKPFLQVTLNTCWGSGALTPLSLL